MLIKKLPFRRSNATIWQTSEGEALQSYSTFVVWTPRDSGEPWFLSENWDCSVTTTRQVGKYLEMTSKGIRKAISQGRMLVFRQGELDKLIWEACEKEGPK